MATELINSASDNLNNSASDNLNNNASKKLNIISFDDEIDINSLEEFQLHPIYNILLDDFPIISKYNKDINNNYSNIQLNFNNESISNVISKYTLIPLIRCLTNMNNTLTKSNKIVNAVVLYEILLNNKYFLIEHKKFFDTCFNKINEFKNDNYNDFDVLKIYNNNINPIDTIIYNFNILNSKIIENTNNTNNTNNNTNINTNNNNNTNNNLLKNIPTDILTKYKLVHNVENNNKLLIQKQKIVTLGNFNFKTNYNMINEEEFNILFGIYLDILLSSNNNYDIVIVYGLIFELFINNIDFIKKDPLLKSFLINKNKELLKSNYSDFQNIKSHNYNKNPLETVFHLLKFYF